MIGSLGLLWGLFAGALLYACVTDVRTRRIPNSLVLLLLAMGFVYSAVARPPFYVGLGWAFASAALGFSIWFPFYLFRMLGAGDVKLFAAASTWLAPSLVLESALATALVGGALALFWFFRSQGAKLATVRLLHATRQPGILREALPVTSRHQRVPYGVAMTLGLLVTVWRFDAWLH